MSIVMLSEAAFWKNPSIVLFMLGVSRDSVPPQLIEMTDGALAVSCMAVEMTSRKSWSVFGAKYTAYVAPGAIAPEISISPVTSKLAFWSFGLKLLVAPFTDTSTVVG